VILLDISNTAYLLVEGLAVKEQRLLGLTICSCWSGGDIPPCCLDGAKGRGL
jgi:hypothetical protein